MMPAPLDLKAELKSKHSFKSSCISESCTSICNPHAKEPDGSIVRNNNVKRDVAECCDVFPNVANMLPNVAIELAEYLREAGYTESQIAEIIDISMQVGTIKKYGGRNMTQEIREWVLATSGNFFITNCNKELGFATISNMAKTRVIFHRLEKEGLIEKVGDQRGHYRRVDTELEPLDWKNANGETVDIKWPFELERIVETMPGNIVCVAGEPNAGKTAFLLNVIQLNMRRSQVHYFNSEMGGGELQKRLERFAPIVKLGDWSFNAWERSGNFADVIRPGKGMLNIIDFMELHEDFWKVGGMLKAIHDKLKGAIAIVALQKNKGCEHGLGGGRGLEKPRLYLTMSPGRCRIVKAKNWATSENPNGLITNFKLHQGCHFAITQEWHREQEKNQ